MKRLIIIILMLFLIPINYVGAEDKETADLAKDKTLMFLKSYLPLVAKYNMVDFLDSIDEQRRIIDFGRMGAEGAITNPINEYENEKSNTSHLSWIIIPNINESQPSGIIQFTYSF